MPHVMFGGLVHDQAVLLSKRLSKLLNNKLEKVFFTDSGSVSVEVALKIAIQYWINKGNDKKNKFIFLKTVIMEIPQELWQFVILKKECINYLKII